MTKILIKAEAIYVAAAIQKPVPFQQGIKAGIALPSGEIEYRKPCSLCGAPTPHEEEETQAQWYLCDHCEGTEEAREMGYCHN
jgi:hypothetical protein